MAKAFKQAAAYIPIEDRIIDEALQWLSNNQAPNGSFPEVGRISHRDMQGGAAKGLALTAFTLIAFLENAVSVILFYRGLLILRSFVIPSIKNTILISYIYFSLQQTIFLGTFLFFFYSFTLLREK